MKNVALVPSDLQYETEYVFASLRLKPDGTLWRGAEQVHLPPKGLAALRVLLAHAGSIVTPQQLRRALWGDVHVTADSVPRCVSSLRTALLPDDCIQTVYKQGYRFVAPVRVQAAGEPGAPPPRLAVLPFQSGLGVPDHLGPAVAEETLVRLSRVFTGGFAPFTLLARDSVFTMAQQGSSARQVGEALRADLVLTGSLRALAGQYRLRTEMVRISDDAQIWVEDFLVPQTRTAGLESRLAERLVSRLDAGLSGLDLAAFTVESRESDTDTARREAYERFQRARQELRGNRRTRMQEGLQNLLRATELDPALIPAQLDLIDLCITQSMYGLLSPAVAAEQARRAARAIPHDSDAATIALPGLGWIRFHLERDLDNALRAFEDSAFLPHDPATTRARVLFSLSRHRFDEAIHLLESALQEDSWSPALHARLAWALHLARRPQESLEQIEQALGRFADHEVVLLYGSIILAYHGKCERALDLAERLDRSMPGDEIALPARGYALARAGRAEEAFGTLEHLLMQTSRQLVSSSFVPALCVALENPDAALAALRAAEKSRCPWFFQALADPRLDPLRPYPEFERMLSVLAGMEAQAQRERAQRIAPFLTFRANPAK